ncbi:secernin-2-like [Saccostrea cucullata]|uniref:secernin-2-like n=1 Tax=Saccostrea cuccullata TaxID=36930 RepID=UPI002ED3C560
MNLNDMSNLFCVNGSKRINRCLTCSPGVITGYRTVHRFCSAKNGVDFVTLLINQYGQGGTLDAQNPLPYCGAFLVTDRTEAWVVEWTGKFWVSKQITEGAYSISSCMSISKEYDLASSKLQEQSVALGYWSKEKCPVYFSLAFGAEFPTCLGCVDLIHSAGQDTATPDQSLSVFTPFLFSDNVDIGDTTQSLSNNDRRHILYKYHEKAWKFMSSGTQKGEDLVHFMRNVEERCVSEMDQFCQKFLSRKYVRH